MTTLAQLTHQILTQKIGARHTRQEAQHIQRMHDHAVSLGAECHPLTKRAGARHSRRDQELLQRVHDDCAKLGATCEALPERDEVFGLQTHRQRSDAINYHPATSPRRCENCVHFFGDPGRDWCDKYKFTADPDYISDGWEAGKPDEIPGYQGKADLAALVEGVLVLRGKDQS